MSFLRPLVRGVGLRPRTGTFRAQHASDTFEETARGYWSARILRGFGSANTCSVGDFDMGESAGSADLCTGGTVFYSTQFNGTTEAAANAFDNNLSNRWSNAIGAFPARIGYQMAADQAVTDFRMWARNDAQPIYAPIGVDFEWSSDGATHYCYGSVDDAAWSDGENKIFNFEGSPYSAYTVWRVYSRTAQDAGATIRIAEIEFAATHGGADQCSGGTAGGTGVSPSNAFDNSAATQTSSSSQLRHFWQYTFSGATAARECRITSSTDTANPADIFIQFRLANGNWKTAAQSTGLTWTSNEQKVFQW